MCYHIRMVPSLPPLEPFIENDSDSSAVPHEDVSEPVNNEYCSYEKQARVNKVQHQDRNDSHDAVEEYDIEVLNEIGV